MPGVWIASVLFLLMNGDRRPAVPSRATNQPVCSAGAICFSGKVAAREWFRKAINDYLEFVLSPDDAGWTIKIVPTPGERDCDELAGVVNPPYRYHSDLDVNMSYAVSAEEEVADSPRNFNFVTNCKDYRTESARLQIVLWPYSYSEKQVDQAQAQLGTSLLGKGRLWITGAQVTHAGDTADSKLGNIAWMKFSVEIRLPAEKARAAR